MSGNKSSKRSFPILFCTEICVSGVSLFKYGILRKIITKTPATDANINMSGIKMNILSRVD